MTPTTPTIVQSATLYFREGSSDKVYQANIEAADGGHVVTFAYGRRGSTMNTGTKTSQPVSLAEATKVYEKLVASKTAKGYTPGEHGTPYSGIENPDGQPRDTGIRCQLLNPVDETELERLLDDDRHCLQRKHDGRRLLVRKSGGTITGINRRGLVVPLPGPVHEAVAAIGHDLLIDGEAVGDTLHAFDLLESGSTDMRPVDYLSRYHSLLALFADSLPGVNVVATTVDPPDKRRMFENCRDARGEGVVFKNRHAPFTPGRPASGGDWLKYKFVETASFVAGEANGSRGKRSVALWLTDDAGNRVPAGNVTIPPNHAIPAPGSVVEVKYLHAFRESGSVHQPVYLGPRDDIPADECSVSQLKFKPEPVTA